MSDHCSQRSAHVLYAEDDPLSGRLVQSIVEPEGYSLRVVATGEELLRALPDERPDVILLDLHLPDASGLDLLAKARARYPELPVVVLTASNSVDNVVRALKAGAIDYLTKPVDHQRLLVSLGNAVKMLQQQQDLNKLRSEISESYRLEHMIGNAPSMIALRSLIRQAARSDATVLIIGESGTGKELVAKALHYASPRAAKPFVDVNCAALTETLIESELFGHERGAFTGALSRRRGKFEQANCGSLFLDEIGDMPPPTQAKMLRVLQERSFQRVGGEDRIHVDVRVICATNQNLEAALQKGTFRLDLFYRINMITIEIPPLRERKSDIPELARHFLAKGIRSGHHVEGISEAAMAALTQHDWPGNVRELENVIQRALTICEEGEIQPSHLPASVLRTARVGSRSDGAQETRGLIEAVEQFERTIIVAALEKFDWNKTRAAVSLGVTRRILSYKMQNLGIERPPQEH